MLKCVERHIPRCAASCWFQYFKPGSNRTVNKKVTNFRRFRHLRLNDILANKSIQICQKVTGRDKNLESRPSALDIPSGYEKIKISDLRQRLVGFYSWPDPSESAKSKNGDFGIRPQLGGPRPDACLSEGCEFLSACSRPLPAAIGPVSARPSLTVTVPRVLEGGRHQLS